MTLPATGSVSLSSVSTELGASTSSLRSLNDASVRAMASIPAGTISMSNLRGKSNPVVTASSPVTYSYIPPPALEFWIASSWSTPVSFGGTTLLALREIFQHSTFQGLSVATAAAPTSWPTLRVNGYLWTRISSPVYNPSDGYYYTTYSAAMDLYNYATVTVQVG